MKHKIVVITGSARVNGNSSTMANAFIEESERLGYTVEKIDAPKLQIRPCIACNQCYSKGNPCVFDDDFNKIADKLLNADAIVIAAPVYWYSFPTAVKAVVDKFFALYSGKRLFSGKKCALLSCCEDNTMEAFNGLVFAYSESFKLMGAELSGEVLIPDVNEIGDILKTDGIERAKALASNLFGNE